MVESPCINVCQMDPATRLCRGCFRTIDEIAAWARLSDASRQQILDAIVLRRPTDAPSRPLGAGR